MTSKTVSRRRDLSLTRGLQYFEAAARLQSVKHAAAELGISQSAVSHQLRQLTESLGEQLLVRTGKGIALTPAGQRLAEKLTSTFDGLQTAVAEIVGTGRQTLRLAVCSSFGPGWLIGRLDSFLLACPGVDLQLKLYSQDPELTDQVADAFVTALPLQPGFAGVHVLDEMLTAVHAPRRVDAGERGLHRLITTDVDARNLGEDWLDYCAHAGLALDDIQQGPWLQCTHYMLAFEMAKAGLGVALVPDFLARRDVASGLLARFDKTLLPSGRSYHLCYKQSRAQERGIQALGHWFKSQLETPAGVNAARAGAG